MDRRFTASAFQPNIPLVAAKDLTVYGSLVCVGEFIPDTVDERIRSRMWQTRRASYATPEQLAAREAAAKAAEGGQKVVKPADPAGDKVEVQFTPASLGQKAADGTYPIIGPDGTTVLESLKPKAAAEKRLKEVNAGLQAEAEKKAANEAAAKAAEGGNQQEVGAQ